MTATDRFTKYYSPYSNFSTYNTITNYESGRTLLSKAKKVITNLNQTYSSRYVGCDIIKTKSHFSTECVFTRFVKFAQQAAVVSGQVTQS
jgi:hypothetical protein